MTDSLLSLLLAHLFFTTQCLQARVLEALLLLLDHSSSELLYSVRMTSVYALAVAGLGRLSERNTEFSGHCTMGKGARVHHSMRKVLQRP